MPVALFCMDTILNSFDRRFAVIYERSLSVLRSIPDADLFLRPRQLERSMAMFSFGEYILRSGAAVEQTFLGITTRLWDDPFEWTLPEKLSSVNLVTGYLNEVEVTRKKAFAFFSSDDDLNRQIPAPETLRSIFDLLLETIARAEHYQGRAFAIFQMLSDEKLPRL